MRSVCILMPIEKSKAVPGANLLLNAECETLFLHLQVSVRLRAACAASLNVRIERDSSRLRDWDKQSTSLGRLRRPEPRGLLLQFCMLKIYERTVMCTHVLMQTHTLSNQTSM